MKKFVALLFFMAMVFVSLPKTAYAENYNLYVDNRYIDMSAFGSYRQGDIWMVQVRLIAALLNLGVRYDENNKIVSLIMPERDGYDKVELVFHNNNALAHLVKYSNVGIYDEVVLLRKPAAIGSDNRMYVDLKTVAEAFYSRYYENTTSGRYPAGIYIYTEHHIYTGGAMQYQGGSEKKRETGPVTDTYPFTSKGAIWIADRSNIVDYVSDSNSTEETSLQAVAFLNRKQLAFLIDELYNSNKYGYSDLSKSVVNNSLQNVSGEILASAINFITKLGGVSASMTSVMIGTVISVACEDNEISSYDVMSDVLAQITLNDDKGFAKLEFYKTVHEGVVVAGVQPIPIYKERYSMKVSYYASDEVFNSLCNKGIGHWVKFGTAADFKKEYAEFMLGRASFEPLPKTETTDTVVETIPPDSSEDESSEDELGVVEVVSPKDGHSYSGDVHVKWEKYAPNNKTKIRITDLDADDERSYNCSSSKVERDFSLEPRRYKLVVESKYDGEVKAVSKEIFFTVTSPEESEQDNSYEPEPSGEAEEADQTEPVQSHAKLEITGSYPRDSQRNVSINQCLSINFSRSVVKGDSFDSIRLRDKEGRRIDFTAEIPKYDTKRLEITPCSHFEPDDTITVSIPENAVQSEDDGVPNEEFSFSFSTESSAEFPKLSGTTVYNKNKGGVDFSQDIFYGPDSDQIYITDEDSNIIRVDTQIRDNEIFFDISYLEKGKRYYYFIGANALETSGGITNTREYSLSFDL